MPSEQSHGERLRFRFILCLFRINVFLFRLQPDRTEVLEHRCPSPDGPVQESAPTGKRVEMCDVKMCVFQGVYRILGLNIRPKMRIVCCARRRFLTERAMRFLIERAFKKVYRWKKTSPLRWQHLARELWKWTRAGGQAGRGQMTQTEWKKGLDRKNRHRSVVLTRSSVEEMYTVAKKCGRWTLRLCLVLFSPIVSASSGFCQ